ncbi:uncharacterized protein MELLADRAFT_107063 [Melampsora larici-populina 98AG31]|uniref:Uncharacterized protein n=1 Tax=Melampsora larici-populina (strain 98AG31 / pathotype 3-4-7) TaxID=747676 RepID=F4RNJ5_MELLP|nr:uncharacterized protein MELLADRAFT_107063 [Melampsora larici-populina 98AG31]EGG05999.1 hypothetical protein MELLADRAFT_107063 [Melampsora larici-populina 98AG31]
MDYLVKDAWGSVFAKIDRKFLGVALHEINWKRVTWPNLSAVASPLLNVTLGLKSNNLQSQQASSSRSPRSWETPDILTKIDKLTPKSNGEASQSQKAGTMIPTAVTIGQKRKTTQPH